MVYAKTFTAFARHAFQKAAFAGHGSPSGAAHAGSFFNQSFSGAARTQLGPGAIASRFQSQFGAHAGKNNPNPSFPNSQSSLHSSQYPLVTAATNDDGNDKELHYGTSAAIARHLSQSILAPATGTELAHPGSRSYSTAAGDAAPSAGEDGLVVDTEQPAFQDLHLQPNLPMDSLPPSIELYEKEVSALLEQGDFHSVISVYHSMKQHGFVPTADLYDSIILSMSRTRAKRPVNDILDTYTEMLNRKVQPEISTVSIVIETLCSRSAEVVELINEANLKLERGSHDKSETRAQIAQLHQEKNVDKALDLFNTSSDSLYKPHSIQTFNAILGALSQHAMNVEALQVYTRLEASHVRPTAETFVHLITVFGKHNDMKSALECYNEYTIRARELPGHDEDVVYEALISSYFATGDPKGGIQFLTKIRAFPGKYISRSLLNAAVAGLCRLGELDKALDWIHDMKRTATLPNPAVSSVRPVVLSASQAGNLQVAKEAFDALGDGRIGTAHLWKSELQLFASLCLREGDLPTAVIVMDELILQNILPDSDVGATFLCNLATVSGIDRALEYLERFAKIQTVPADAESSNLELELLVHRFITDIGPLDVPTASRIVAILHTLPDVLTRAPSIAAKALLSPFSSHLEDLIVDGITLAGLVKFQATLTGWQDSKPEDHSRLIQVLCTIRPEDWMYLRQAESSISDHLLRIRDPELLSLWTEILSSVDVLNANQLGAPISPTINTAASNYSPDDAASIATMDTNITPPSSYQTMYRQLPARYYFNIRRSPDINMMHSMHIVKNLGKAQRDSTQLNKLLEVVRRSKHRGERLAPEALGRLINTAGKVRRVEVFTEVFEFAESTVREVIPEHEVAFDEWCLILNSMIVAHAFNKNFGEARQYQQELMKLGVAPDADAFAAYIVNINVTDTNDEATEALALFHEAKSLGVPCSTFLYNTLIGKLAKARRSDDALYYFHEMCANGINPSSVTYGTVINACCRVGNETLALKYFNDMESDQFFVPRIAPYNTMLQFYVQTKQDRTAALRFYEKMRAQLLIPSAHTYKLLIDAYATLEPVDLDAAENILRLIRSDGQRPTSTHYAALIHTYGCVKQDLETAKAWFHKVTNPEFENRVPPDEALYQALIEAYVANHKVADCNEVFRHMRANDVKLTVYMANHLIHGWTIAGNLEEARKVFDSLASGKNGLYGREPSSYEQMTRTYLAMGDRDSALALVGEMRSRGYPAAVVARVTDILEGGEGLLGVYTSKSPMEDISTSSI
jgi:pentatricopeptide repeat protein